MLFCFARYQSFLSERMHYKWSSLNFNDHQYDTHFVPPFSAAANVDEFFYGHRQHSPPLSGVAATGGLHNQVILSSTHDKQDLTAFYTNNKQTYAYNVSIEKHCFSNINFNYVASNNDENSLNIWIAVDNVKTLLVDDYIMTTGATNDSNLINTNNNINFLLNVKYFVLSPDALQNVHKMRVEFLNEPKLFKFGLMPSRVPYKSPRRFELIGIDLNRVTKKAKSLLDTALFNDALNAEEDNIEPSSASGISSGDSGLVTVDDYCHLAFASSKDALFRIESRNNAIMTGASAAAPVCTCQYVNIYLNQIKDLKSAASLLVDCQLRDGFEFVLKCRQQLLDKCLADTSSQLDATGLVLLNKQYGENYLSDFIKFWDYCITEADPYQQQFGTNSHDQLLQQNHAAKSNYFFSNTDLDTGN